jgi:hypothetical protein
MRRVENIREDKHNIRGLDKTKTKQGKISDGINKTGGKTKDEERSKTRTRPDNTKQHNIRQASAYIFTGGREGQGRTNMNANTPR